MFLDFLIKIITMIIIIIITIINNKIDKQIINGILIDRIDRRIDVLDNGVIYKINSISSNLYLFLSSIDFSKIIPGNFV